MEEVVKEKEEEKENFTGTSCSHFYPYVPGKSNPVLPNVRFNSTVLSEKDTSDSTSRSDNDRLSKPINLFSSEFRKIDKDLKKMHRIWSNID